MKNPTLPNPCLFTATSLVIEKITNEIRLRAKELQNSDLTNLTYMQARLEILKILGFKSEHMLSKFIDDLKSNAVHRHQTIYYKDCLNRQPKENESYYSFEAAFDLEYDDGELSLSESSIMIRNIRTLDSYWVSYKDSSYTVELRKASITNPDNIIEYGRESGIPVLIINTEIELFYWMISFGGIALIPNKLVQNNAYLSRWLLPYPNVMGWK